MATVKSFLKNFVPIQGPGQHFSKILSIVKHRKRCCKLKIAGKYAGFDSHLLSHHYSSIFKPEL